MNGNWTWFLFADGRGRGEGGKKSQYLTKDVPGIINFFYFSVAVHPLFLKIRILCRIFFGKDRSGAAFQILMAPELHYSWHQKLHYL